MAIRLNLCQWFAKCESGEGGTFQDFVEGGSRQGVCATEAESGKPGFRPFIAWTLLHSAATEVVAARERRDQQSAGPRGIELLRSLSVDGDHGARRHSLHEAVQIVGGGVPEGTDP